jgi:hypothetical protein
MAIKEPFEARAGIAQDRANLSKAGTEIIKRRRMTLKLIASTGLRFRWKSYSLLAGGHQRAVI